MKASTRVYKLKYTSDKSVYKYADHLMYRMFLLYMEMLSYLEMHRLFRLISAVDWWLY